MEDSCENAVEKRSTELNLAADGVSYRKGHTSEKGSSRYACMRQLLPLAQRLFFFAACCIVVFGLALSVNLLK